MPQDLRYALRSFRKSLGFTAVVLAVLALGIGANTAIFSVIDAVLLRALPFRDPGRLVMIWQDASRIGFPRATPSPGDFFDWKAQNSVFEDMAFVNWRTANLTGDGPPERITIGAVSSGLLPMLGVEPFSGRLFRPEEDAPEAPKVVLVSYGLWQRRYGGDPALVGRTIDLNDSKILVIGIMPPRFQFLMDDAEIWTPAALPATERTNRGSHYLMVAARLKPGVSVAQAQSEMNVLCQRMAQEHPLDSRDLRTIVLPLREQLAGGVRLTLMTLLAAVAGVLLIACANVANLLLSRATVRRREIALRAALGADRSRLLRQLLTESILLAALGGAAGILVATWSLSLLERLVPSGMTTLAHLSLDGPVLVFALVLTLATGVIFGIAPALSASRLDLNEALKLGGGRSSGGDRRLRSVLIVGEIAVALVLLICSALMIQTFLRLRAVDPGFRADNVLTVRTALSPVYSSLAKRSAYYHEVLDRVQRLPGVTAAAYATAVPLTFKGGTRGFSIEGRVRQPGQDALYRQVTPGYFRILSIALREGRYLEEADGPDSPLVAVVNETMARKFWPGENVIGKRIRGDILAPGRWITIAGIVADVKEMGLEVAPKAALYIPCYQDESFSYSPNDLFIRTAGDATALVAAVRREIWAVNPQQPISKIRTMDQVVAAEMTDRRMQMTLLGIFAALALLLAALGIYGVISYAVARRTQEIGVRMALGAARGQVLRLVFRNGLTLAALGIAIGLLGALAASRLLAGLLFGVRTWDPLAFLAAPLALLAVALVACYVPARRAARVDPMVALRYE